MTNHHIQEEIVPYFNDADEVYKTIGRFLEEITRDEEMRPKFLASDTSFLVVYADPTARMLVDCTTDPVTVTLDPPQDAEAEITLGMSADDGHKFWMGKLNMTLALAKKHVQVAGPMSKMMKLLPAMRPAFPRYNAFLEANGFVDGVK